MRSRRWLVVAVLLIPTAARADDHTAGAGGGPGFCNGCGSKLGGIHGMFEVSWPYGWPKGGVLHDHFSIATDFSVHWGSPNGVDRTRAAFLIGGRVHDRWGKRHVPSVHVLAGLVRSHSSAAIRNNVAVAAGVGYEFLLGDATYSDGWSLRAQVDRVAVKNDDGFPRYSFGVIYRFKHPQP